MIKLGSTDITNVMLGTTKVDAIFLGNTKVYPNLPVVEGVYVYHVDKKFYTFPEFQNTFLVPDVGIGVDDLNGRQNTEVLFNSFHNVAGSNKYAAGYAYRFTPVPIGTSWYLPSIGELIIIHRYVSELNDRIFDTFGFSYFPSSGAKAFWSSTQGDATTAWQLSIFADEPHTAVKRNPNVALPVIKLG